LARITPSELSIPAYFLLLVEFGARTLGDNMITRKDYILTALRAKFGLSEFPARKVILGKVDKGLKHKISSSGDVTMKEIQGVFGKQGECKK